MYNYTIEKKIEFYNKFNFIFGILLDLRSPPFGKRLLVVVVAAGGIIVHSNACVANCKVVTVVSYDCESVPSNANI